MTSTSRASGALAPAVQRLDGVARPLRRLRVRLAVAPRLPERRPDVPGGDGVDAHPALGLVDGQRLGEGGDRALGADEGGAVLSTIISWYT